MFEEAEAVCNLLPMSMARKAPGSPVPLCVQWSVPRAPIPHSTPSPRTSTLVVVYLSSLSLSLSLHLLTHLRASRSWHRCQPWTTGIHAAGLSNTRSTAMCSVRNESSFPPSPRIGVNVFYIMASLEESGRWRCGNDRQDDKGSKRRAEVEERRGGENGVSGSKHQRGLRAASKNRKHQREVGTTANDGGQEDGTKGADQQRATWRLPWEGCF